jgi:L-lactate dehydrogenase complex protein LldG
MSGIIQNRESFLERIAARLGRDRISQVDNPNWKHKPQDEVLKDASQDELVEILQKQCENIHTDVVITNSTRLSSIIKQKIDQYGGGPLVLWNDERFESFQEKGELFQGEMKCHIWDHEKGEENIQMAEQANIGITMSDLTLAESGTVVLFSSRDKGRTVSFLPRASIILVPKSSIVPRMTQAARIISKKIRNGEKIASCINFITGPSNSADIEMILVVGVHGPTKASYIIIEDI